MEGLHVNYLCEKRDGRITVAVMDGLSKVIAYKYGVHGALALKLVTKYCEKYGLDHYFTMSEKIYLKKDGGK